MALIKTNARSATALDATILTGTVPSDSYTSGISQSSQWRLSGNVTGDADPISSNWEENDSTGYARIGSAMTQSSGIFSFPSTGIWMIIFNASWFTSASAGESDYNRINIKVTTNNSSYTNVAETSNYLPGTGGDDEGGGHSVRYQFDVTDTANCKVKFDSWVQNNSTGLRGSSTVNLTTVTFQRIGDT